MKMLYELNERVEHISYIKECTKNLQGALEVYDITYALSKDEAMSKQSIKGTMIILQEYCKFLYENISELQDDMRVLLEDLQKIVGKVKAGEIV